MLGVSGTFNFMIVFTAEPQRVDAPLPYVGRDRSFLAARCSPRCMVLWSLPLLVRETTEDESQNNGYRFGQEEETYKHRGGSWLLWAGDLSTCVL